MISNKFFKENALKKIKEIKDNQSYKIPVHMEGELKGYLVPVQNTEEIIRLLKEWREKTQHAYPTVFKPSIEGTKIWLENKVIKNEDRIFFMLIDLHGNFIGHMGFSNINAEELSVETDLARGTDSIKGIMTYAYNALLDWIFYDFHAEKVVAKAFRDNEKSIMIHLKCGFERKKDIPLKKVETGEGNYKFDEIENVDEADRIFCLLELKNPNFRTKKRILTAGPFVGRNEIMYVNNAVKSGWNENWKYYLSKFEESFSKYVGVKYAFCTSSCTGALHLALATLGIKEGDEVIVPDLTWIASASIIKYLGATPIFVDIDPETWTISPEAVERAISSRTKAIIPVHLYGHPAEMDKILEIARKNNLYVVEDAAPSIGAEFNGQRTGGFGDFAAFSFQGAKLLVTGEGGMLLTNNKELYEKAKNLNDHGRDPKIPFWINQIGYKYKMSNMQAAFGLAQLEKIDQLIKCKRRIFEWYRNGLEGVEGIKLNYESTKKGVKSIYWMTSILLEDKVNMRREEFMKRLSEEFDIDTRPVFPKMSGFPMFEEVDNKNADKISKRAINLPSGVCLTKEDVDYVCNSIKKILNQP